MRCAAPRLACSKNKAEVAERQQQKNIFPSALFLVATAAATPAIYSHTKIPCTYTTKHAHSHTPVHLQRPRHLHRDPTQCHSRSSATLACSTRLSIGRSRPSNTILLLCSTLPYLCPYSYPYCTCSSHLDFSQILLPLREYRAQQDVKVARLRQGRLASSGLSPAQTMDQFVSKIPKHT